MCVCVSNMGSTLIVYVQRRKSHSRGRVYDEIKLVIDSSRMLKNEGRQGPKSVRLHISN